MGTLHIEQVSLGHKRATGNWAAVYAQAANGTVYRYVTKMDDSLMHDSSTGEDNCSPAQAFVAKVVDAGVINTEYWTKWAPIRERGPRAKARGPRAVGNVRREA